MFVLPVLTLFLLAPIYNINKKIFIAILLLECALFLGGYFYITMNFVTMMNKTLYYTALG